MIAMSHEEPDAKPDAVPLTKEDVEDWRRKIKQKIFADFCGDPNEAHGDNLQASFDKLCDLALAGLAASEIAHPDAYIEHHKGGNNLVWEETNLPCTPLYKRAEHATPNTTLQKERDLFVLDARRLDWLDQQGDPGVPWVARQSGTGRGYRLHQDPEARAHGYVGGHSPRAAIDAAMSSQSEREDRK